MHSPFPGMNPYLENPALWAEVHHRLISSIAITLGPSLRPKYRVAIEKRTYLSEAEEVREGYSEIREVATGRVVTSIEVLSPKNKRFSMREATPTGNGRDAYLSKRQRVLGSLTHLVEIDLLRWSTTAQRASGRAMDLLTEMPSCHYRILVSRVNVGPRPTGGHRPQAQLYGFNLQQPIPTIPIPLERGDGEPLLGLQKLLDEVYEQAGFDLTIDYSQAPIPGLSKEDQSWWAGVSGGGN